MISSTWITALRLFARAWARFLFASGKLSPANWDRVVLIYFGLFLVSISWLMHITSTYEEGARTDLTDAQLTLEKKITQQQDFSKRRFESSTSWTTKNGSDQVELATITEPSTGSTPKRANRRTSIIRHKRNRRISGKDESLIGNFRSSRSSSSAPTAAVDGVSQNQSAGWTAEPILKAKIQTTTAEAANNSSPVSISTPDQPRTPLLSVKPDAKLTQAKADTDMENWEFLAMNYGPSCIGNKVYANRIDVDPTGCVDCKFEEFFLSAWSVGDPAMLVDQPEKSSELSASTNHVKFRIHHGGPDVYHLHAHQWSQSPDEGSSLFFRGNSGNNVEYWHTNLVPNYYLADEFQVRTPTDILGQHIHLVKFDLTSSDGAGNGFNYEDGIFIPDEIGKMIQPSNIQRLYLDLAIDSENLNRTSRTIFTHDHFEPSTHLQAGLYAGLVIEPRDSEWKTANQTAFAVNPNIPNPDPWTPLMRAYQDDKIQIRTLVGAHVYAHDFNLAGPRWFAETLWNNSGYRSNQPMGLSEHFELLFKAQPSLASKTARQPAITNKTDSNQVKIEPKHQEQQSSAYVVDVPKELPKTLAATPNDKNITILFWLYLFSTMVNGLSTSSAIVLAWMSNNRAKAELILKQAEARRQAKEQELRIRELELRLAQLELDASGASKLIIVRR